MGFRLKVEGAETIELGEKNILSVKCQRKASPVIEITGRIITAVDGERADDTMKLALWSLVPAEKADTYRKVTVETIAAGQVVRNISFPNAFIVDYFEDFIKTSGVGTFYLKIKQKRDKKEDVKIAGGYAD